MKHEIVKEKKTHLIQPHDYYIFLMDELLIIHCIIFDRQIRHAVLPYKLLLDQNKRLSDHYQLNTKRFIYNVCFFINYLLNF